MGPSHRGGGSIIMRVQDLYSDDKDEKKNGVLEWSSLCFIFFARLRSVTVANDSVDDGLARLLPLETWCFSPGHVLTHS